MAVYGG